LGGFSFLANNDHQIIHSFFQVNPTYLPAKQCSKRRGKYMLKTRTINLRRSDIKMLELDLNKLILHYAQCNKSEGKSPRTVSWYTEALGVFTKFLYGAGRKLELSEVSISSVREFIIAQQVKVLSPFTVQGRVRALKAFSSWLFREGYIEQNILSNVKLPKVPIKIIEPLTCPR
jgi:site-specific recombinase XerD